MRICAPAQHGTGCSTAPQPAYLGTVARCALERATQLGTCRGIEAEFVVGVDLAGVTPLYLHHHQALASLEGGGRRGEGEESGRREVCRQRLMWVLWSEGAMQQSPRAKDANKGSWGFAVRCALHRPPPHPTPPLPSPRQTPSPY
jgi:hypothetical protein